MKNYTNPKKEGSTQDPKDLLNTSLIFARALGLILNEKKGVVVDIVGDVDLGEDVKKVIVFNYQGQVRILKCEEDHPEGTNLEMMNLIQ